MAALAGTETVLLGTVSGGVISGSQGTSLAVGLLGRSTPTPANNGVSVGSSTTLTAAYLIAGTITRSGPTGAFTDTLDTAANIIAALPTTMPTNYGWQILYRNTTVYAATIATASGITLTGIVVVPANSMWIGQAVMTSGSTVSVQGVGVAPMTLGVLETNTNITTAGAGTLTAAGLAGGVITRSGPTAAFTDTTTTGTLLSGQLPNPMVGQGWEVSIINTVAFAQTFAAGSGITLSGLTGPVPGNSTSRWLITNTAANAFTMQLISITVNASLGYNPSNIATAFGGGTGTYGAEGKLKVDVSAAGANPGSTAGDYVLASFSIPASSFDVAGRGVKVSAWGSFAATGNNKTVKIIANPASATVGNVVGASGTTIATTGVVTTNNGSWMIEAYLYKYGAAGSNTQIGASGLVVCKGTVIDGGAPALVTATESGAIFVAVTGNAATAATDIVYNMSVFEGSN